MVFDSFDQENVGSYVCSAKNNFGGDTKEVKIDIKLAPVLTISHSNLKLKNGEQGSLKCSVVDGAKNIKWKSGSSDVKNFVSIL